MLIWMPNAFVCSRKICYNTWMRNSPLVACTLPMGTDNVFRWLAEAVHQPPEKPNRNKWRGERLTPHIGSLLSENVRMYILPKQHEVNTECNAMQTLSTMYFPHLFRMEAFCVDFCNILLDLLANTLSRIYTSLQANRAHTVEHIGKLLVRCVCACASWSTLLLAFNLNINRAHVRQTAK